MGMLAGINMARLINGEEPFVFPELTAIGSMAKYISNPTVLNFQPMNANFGLLPTLKEKIRDKRQKNRRIAEIAINTIKEFVSLNKINVEY
jgi:methylenetetrahydrofolate--tRNA-(uracil-5-)-methyltransferase